MGERRTAEMRRPDRAAVSGAGEMHLDSRFRLNGLQEAAAGVFPGDHVHVSASLNTGLKKLTPSALSPPNTHTHHLTPTLH